MPLGGRGTNAREALEASRSRLHDVLILDSDLEGGALYTVCRNIWPRSNPGIIALIRDSGGHCRTAALNAGADDYLTERFVFAESLARVRAVLRRITPRGIGRPDPPRQSRHRFAIPQGLSPRHADHPSDRQRGCRLKVEPTGMRQTAAESAARLEFLL